MSAKKPNLTWNLDLLYNGDNDPQIKKDRQESIAQVEKFVKKWSKAKSYLTSTRSLKEALDEYERLFRYVGLNSKADYYFSLRESQNQLSTDIKAKSNQAQELRIKLWNQIQFFKNSLARITPALQKKFLTSSELEPYKHFLEGIFIEGKFLLSDNEEKILNLKSQTSYSAWVRMTQSFLSKEQRDNKTLSVLMGEINSPKKKVRDSAAKGVNDILQKYVEVAEQELNSVLGNKKIDDELKGYPRPDSSRHLNDDIDTNVVDSLIKAVSERFYLSSRYYKLKAKLLGVKKLEYHERNVEISNAEKKYSFEESVALVRKVLKSLDNELLSFFDGFLANGQIDVYPKKGKRDGAFCSYYLITHPSFILLNHNNKLRDVTTLAHEFGHGVNNELIKKSQNSLNFGTPTSTAEVASTFMEDFVLSELFTKAKEKERLTLVMMKLNDDISTIFRQVACYMFEQELHQTFRIKGYLSHIEIGKLFQKHMSSYMGKAVLQSQGSQNWWVYWGHIRNYFYNYSYASGLLISKALQSKVKQDPHFILKVKEFLSKGLSDSPKNIFKDLGVDIANKKFWDQGLDEVESLLKEAEKLAKKM